MLQFIYDLVDSEDVPFYVGISDNPNARFKGHLSDTSTNKEKVAKIQNLLDAGIQPTMRIIEVVEGREQGLLREQHWIQTYGDQGILLANIAHTQNSARYIPQASRQQIVEDFLSDLPPGRKLKDFHLYELWFTFHGMYPQETVEQFLALIPPERFFRESGKWFKIHIENRGKPFIPHCSF